MTNQDDENSPLPENQSPLPASLGRLIAGLALESGFQLQDQLKKWEADHPANAIIDQAPEVDSTSAADGEQLVYAAYGLASNLAGSAMRMAQLAGNAAGKGLTPVRRLFGARAFSPLQSRFDSLVRRGEETVETLAGAGRTEATRSRQMARDLTKDLVATTATGFADNPGINQVIQGQIELLLQDLPAQARVDALVQALVANYMLYLQEHPEQVEGLVRSQADIYIDHLSENPEQVQILVQGQSVGLVEEVGDEVRERLVTADSLAEMLLRRILRRPQRDPTTGLLDGQFLPSGRPDGAGTQEG